MLSRDRSGHETAAIVLRNLDDELKQRLSERAARHGRSMAAELRKIARDALGTPAKNPNVEFRKLAAELRKLSAGRRQTPSELLLREDRDNGVRGRHWLRETKVDES